MTIESVLTILSIVTASLILLVGVVLLTGWYLPGQVPDNYRYTIGAVMTLYAFYRIATAGSRFRRKDTGDESDDPDDPDDSAA
jgi:membrane protein YdbS with pleckstrin-like domain